MLDAGMFEASSSWEGIFEPINTSASEPFEKNFFLNQIWRHGSVAAENGKFDVWRETPTENWKLKTTKK